MLYNQEESLLFERICPESSVNSSSLINGSHDQEHLTSDTIQRLPTQQNLHHDRNYETSVMSSDTNPIVGVGVQETSHTSTVEILTTVWPWILSLFITFMICLSVFPSIAALVDSKEKGKVTGPSFTYFHWMDNFQIAIFQWHVYDYELCIVGQGYSWNDKYFTPVGCFLLFNVGDYVGIMLASIIKWPKSTKTGSMVVLLVSVSRLAFIPILLFCNASPMNRHRTQVNYTNNCRKRLDTNNHIFYQ